MIKAEEGGVAVKLLAATVVDALTLEAIFSILVAVNVGKTV